MTDLSCPECGGEIGWKVDGSNCDRCVDRLVRMNCLRSRIESLKSDVEGKGKLEILLRKFVRCVPEKKGWEPTGATFMSEMELAIELRERGCPG